MGSRAPGTVVRFEIGTTDTEAVTGFYGELLGWRFERESDASGSAHTLIFAPGTTHPMGTVHGDCEGTGLAIASADPDTETERLTRMGATVAEKPAQRPDGARLAWLRDPRGNLLALVSQADAERERELAAREDLDAGVYAPKPGSFAWFEIGTADFRATRRFYTDAFGWRFAATEAFRNEPYYEIFTGDDWPSGGLWDHGTDYAMPSVLVADVSGKAAKAAKLGATVESGPSGRPDGLVFARLRDPLGNRFGIFSMPSDGAYAA